MSERPGFASDNHAGVHAEVMDAVVAANAGHAAAYGGDPWTARAAERFREHFGPSARAFPVFNGTAANVLSLIALTQPWQGGGGAGPAPPPPRPAGGGGGRAGGGGPKAADRRAARRPADARADRAAARAHRRRARDP